MCEIFVCYSTWARAPGTAFWLVHNWPLGLRGIYITLGYTFFSSIENFSTYCPVVRGSILLPPHHLSVLARMARWQLLWKYSISYPSIKNYLLQLSSQDEICPNGHIFKELFFSTICYISTIKDKLTCIYTWLIISSFSATWILIFLTPGSKGVSLASLF